MQEGPALASGPSAEHGNTTCRQETRGSVTSSIPVSLELLQNAFALAEESLRGDANRSITQKITNEAKRVRYEGALNAILRSALSATLPRCEAHLEFNGIDLSLIHEGLIVTAIESKAMVANSHSGDRHRISLDLHGIRTKLYPDARDPNSIQLDMAEISCKIPVGMECPRFEVFVPVVYELYRGGGDESDWFAERKPWVTLPEFRALRDGMRDDFVDWFHLQDPRFTLIHAAEAIELRGANGLWKRQAQHRFPKFTSLKAYVSFYAFGRFVE